MIPRIAGNCFWLGRYLERAENNARLVRMAERHALLPEAFGDPVGLYKPALEVGGTLDDYEARIGLVERDAVLRFMVLDRENSSGIVSCFRSVRDNARTARFLLTDSTWDAINGVHLEAMALTEADLADGALERTLDWALASCRLVRGAREDLLRDTVPHVLALGEAVERADFTARVLAELIPPLLDAQDALPDPGSATARRWLSTLGSLGLLETFRRETGSRLSPERALELILLHPTSPHSLLENARRMDAAIVGFAGERSSRSRDTAQFLARTIASVQVSELVHGGIESFVADLTLITNRLGLEVFEDHFG